MDLASKDSYIQKLASRVISHRDQEPKKRPFVPFKGKSDAGPPKKKKKSKKKHVKDEGSDSKAPNSKQKPSPSPATQKNPATVKPDKSKTENVNGSTTQKPKGGTVDASFSTVDVLRKRLHEKIEASRGQGAPKNSFSEAVQAKRAKRKLERERKKRKRKEFLMKKKAEQSGEEPEIKQEEQQPAPVPSKRIATAIVYNKVETVEEGYIDKMQRKKMKKQSTKGQLTPLTGKNYKQLLKRVEARKEKLEELRQKDETKAKEMETKIKWTNMLYKAEGLKIKDDENMLRTSLKKKEKSHAQKKKRWDARNENVVGKMQQRQDKRRRNIQKRNKVKIEKKKDRARKKGRVLPEDLKKAAV
ncbi:surfeit locus protein 6 [Mugil cephalus]|uniref:surfeit locus protein 6 n=1 Tax=Mugil cephalus TaxID=48193 RepID=UPI001FB6D325|nr:surfeit locus protein 6 [Mugil cephalus]